MIKFIAFTSIFILYLLIDWFFLRKKKRKMYGVPDIVKDTFTKIDIPVNQVEVLTNNYQEEVISDFPSRIEVTDALYDNSRNIRKQEKSASVLVTYFIRNGKKIRWNSETIDLDYNDLIDQLNKQKSITAYYKKEDISNYYFDLKFLE